MRRSARFALAGGAAATALAAWMLRRHASRPAPRPTDAPGTAPVQRLGDGVGPLFRRVYHLDITGSTLTPEALMARIQADPDAYSPGVIARFEKTHGPPERMAVGDEFFIHIRSPWDGPVRVDDVSPTAFRLVTLAGHLEAGAIAFSAWQASEGVLRLAIVSCARSRDAAVHIAYHRLGIARAAQTQMWTTFLQRAAAQAGGKATPVTVRTYTADLDDPLTHADADVPAPLAGLLADLAGRALNFEPDEATGDAPATGWNHDDDSCDLIPELPGPPTPGGTFERAKAFVAAYRHPDPRRLVGVYDPHVALGERTMLLRAQFLGLGFRFGVRTTAPVEETRTGDDGLVHIWSYGYRTLEGHFERGEIMFELQKHQATGRVVFRIHSYSQRGHVANPIYAIGMRLFGRTLQRQFVRHALDRTAQYVEQSLVRDACLNALPIAQRLLRP